MRTGRWLAAAAFGLAGVFLLASCSRAYSQPTITGAELLGTWVGPNGASMTFRADQTVTVHNLNLGWRGPTAHCQSVTATGTWQFLNSQGASGTSPRVYSKGNLVGVEFQAQQIEVCSTEFTTWVATPPLGLCLDLDPDVPCTGSPLVKHHDERAITAAIVITGTPRSCVASPRPGHLGSHW